MARGGYKFFDTDAHVGPYVDVLEPYLTGLLSAAGIAVHHDDERSRRRQPPAARPGRALSGRDPCWPGKLAIMAGHKGHRVRKYRYG